MVFRIYVEKKKEFAQEAAALLADLKMLSAAQGITRVRVINRYDAEGLSRAEFDEATRICSLPG